MKVLVVHNRHVSAWASGEDVVVDAEIALLRRHGHEVRLFERHSDQIRGAAAVIGAAGSTIWSRRSRRELDAEVVSFVPDVVHLHNLYPLISPGVIDVAANSGSGVVATLHNYRRFCTGGMLVRDGKHCEECLGGSSLPGLRHGCYRESRLAAVPATVGQMLHERRRTWDGVHRFICPSDVVRDLHLAAGVPGDRLVVKPHFVDPMPEPAGAGAGGAVYVGRLAESKGILHLLDSWRGLPDIALTIAGDGPLADAVAAHPVLRRDNVVLLGKLGLDEARGVIRDAGVVVVPSLAMETFSLVVRDAMVYGKPIVAPDRGGPGELLDHERSALLYQPGDHGSLAEAIRRLITDPALGERLGAAARADAIERFDAADNHRQLMAIYAAAQVEATAS